jgi:GNAT superfamily N-acetyltransferase
MTSATNRDVKTCGMSWDWADPIRETIFGAPLPGGYTLERVDEDTYWDLHEAELRAHFSPDVLFWADDLMAPTRRAARERVIASEDADRLADYWLVRAPDGALAGVFSARQRLAETFELYHVTMHPDHRGGGLYAELLDRVIAFAQELGFATTVSEHAPCNNAVLIRHLKAGFRIVTMEIDPMHGASVRLAYFHDPVYAAGFGHFDVLDEQFAQSRETARTAASTSSSSTPSTPKRE